MKRSAPALNLYSSSGKRPVNAIANQARIETMNAPVTKALPSSSQGMTRMKRKPVLDRLRSSS